MNDDSAAYTWARRLIAAIGSALVFFSVMRCESPPPTHHFITPAVSRIERTAL
jgi:hypothetical protein